MDEQRVTPGEYVIPRRIARGYQVLPGVGVKDAVFGAVGVAASITLWITLGAFGAGFLLRAGIAVWPLIVGVGLSLPLDEIHVWEWVRNFRQFGRKPKTLHYDWSADDW